MITINKIEGGERSVLITVNGEEQTAPGVFEAFAFGDAVTIRSNNTTKSTLNETRHFSEVLINGAPESSASKAAATLNQFIGNFKSGGGSPGTTPSTDKVSVSDPSVESLSGGAGTQAEVNAELVYSANQQQNKLAEHEGKMPDMTLYTFNYLTLPPNGYDFKLSKIGDSFSDETTLSQWRDGEIKLAFWQRDVAAITSSGSQDLYVSVGSNKYAIGYNATLFAPPVQSPPPLEIIPLNLSVQSKPAMVYGRIYFLQLVNGYVFILNPEGADLSSTPHLWPANTEIALGDGTFGYRATGNISVSASVDSGIPFTGLSVTIDKIIARGGSIKTSTAPNAVYPLGGGSVLPVQSDINYGSPYLGLTIKSTYAFTNAPYDVWVRYTKS